MTPAVPQDHSLTVHSDPQKKTRPSSIIPCWLSFFKLNALATADTRPRVPWKTNHPITNSKYSRNKKDKCGERKDRGNTQPHLCKLWFLSLLTTTNVNPIILIKIFVGRTARRCQQTGLGMRVDMQNQPIVHGAARTKARKRPRTRTSDFLTPSTVNKVGDLSRCDRKAPFSIPATPRSRGGWYYIAPLFPWSLPYNAEC